MEEMEVAGWLEICLKSQMMERKLELQELGQAVQGSVNDMVEDTPGLVNTFALGPALKVPLLAMKGRRRSEGSYCSLALQKCRHGTMYGHVDCHYVGHDDGHNDRDDPE